MEQGQSVAKRLDGAVERLVRRAATGIDERLIAAADQLSIDLTSTSGPSLKTSFRLATTSLRATLQRRGTLDETTSHELTAIVERLEQIERGELPQIVSHPGGRQISARAEQQRRTLLEAFGIQVLGVGQVALHLGNRPRIELLEEVQRVFNDGAIDPPTLERWSRDDRFTSRPRSIEPIGVWGSVSNSSHLSRSNQDSNGWNDVEYEDLAVAHAAYLLATGSDLFCGKICRARIGSLDYCGLVLMDVDSDNLNMALPNHYASKRLL